MASCNCAATIKLSSRYKVCMLWKEPESGSRGTARLLVNRAEDGSFVSEGSSKRRERMIQLSLLFIGFSLALLWGSISFPVALWISVYGKSVWQEMLILYNVPGFFLLFLQLGTDRPFERCFGRYAAWCLRIGGTMAGVATLSWACPFVANYSGKTGWLAYIGVVGLIIGLSHGWIYTYAAVFPANCVAMVLVGNGLANLFLIALQLDSAFPVWLEFWLPCASIATLAVGFFVAFGTRPWVRNVFEGDSEESEAGFVGPAIENSSQHGPGLDTPLLDAAPGMPSKRAVLRRTALAQTCIASLTWTQIGTVALIVYIPNGGQISLMRFASAAIWSTGASTFIGTELAALWNPMRTQRTLAIWSGIHFLFWPPFLWYMFSQKWVNDYFTLVFLSGYFLTTAYLNTEVYRLGLVGLRKSDSDRATTYVNIALYIGVFLGLSCPYWIPTLIEALGVQVPTANSSES